MTRLVAAPLSKRLIDETAPGLFRFDITGSYNFKQPSLAALTWTLLIPLEVEEQLNRNKR